MTAAEPLTTFPDEGLEGVQVATTLQVPVSSAVKTPEFVIVPALPGFTDHARENPSRGLGEAVNVIIDPGATVTEEGLTMSLTGKGFGFGNPFSASEPLPQLVSHGIANITAEAARTTALVLCLSTKLCCCIDVQSYRLGLCTMTPSGRMQSANAS